MSEQMGMQDAPEIRIGSRGSALALAQANLVADALTGAGHPWRIEVIQTAGDRRSPDTAWGEGAFVAAIEQALLDGRVDVAVHSAKDVPTAQDARLRIAAYLPRADPRDALVVPDGSAERRLDDLPTGARIGTDSPRRVGFVLARRPDLVLQPLHGNVDTRLRRLDEGQADALILAAAGLDRLGRGDRIAERLDPDVLPPAPGQGAVAVQIRADDDRLAAACAPLDDWPTRTAVEAERAFLIASGGGCRAPIGALGTVRDGRVELLGGYTSPDGSATAFERVSGAIADVETLGRDLAARLGERLVLPRSGEEPGADASVANAAASGPRVLICRAANQAGKLVRAIEAAGLRAVAVPTIAVEPIAANAALDRAASDIASYEWVVVTSPNGARAILSAAGRASAPLRSPRWAVVGPATRRVLEEGGVETAFEAPDGRAAGIADGLPAENGQRVLVVRGDLAGHELPDALRARGADVDDVVAYRTLEAPESSRPALRRAFEAGPFAAILFTSGSTVRGLINMADGDGGELLAIPAICIGPETAAQARRSGFRVVAEAPDRDPATLAATVVATLARQPQEIT